MNIKISGWELVNVKSLESSCRNRGNGWLHLVLKRNKGKCNSAMTYKIKINLNMLCSFMKYIHLVLKRNKGKCNSAMNMLYSFMKYIIVSNLNAYNDLSSCVNQSLILCFYWRSRNNIFFLIFPRYKRRPHENRKSGC